MRKSILFWLVFALTLLIALYFAVRVTMAALGMGYAARVTKISVKTDQGAATATDIAGIMQLQPGKSVYLINLEKSMEAIAAQSDIQDVSIRRTPSGRILVRTHLRKIIAAWMDGADFYPIAADGRPVGRAFGERPSDTFIFSGDLPDNINNIVAALRATPSVSKNLDHIEWIEGRRWNIYTENGIKILLPENNIDKALAKLAHMQKQNNILFRALSVIDLRDTARTLVKVTDSKQSK